ncbi:MAG: hypothetical protein JNK15_22125 [Planctomycetes bacterium]|nr:hypothetical protein [Planctomycetota bacterium]
MRTLALAIAGLSLSALATAQSLALASVPGNNGNVGGGIYFNLTVNQTLTINSIDYHAKNDGAAGPYMSSFDMFVGPGTYVGNVSANPGPWVQVASTTPVSIVGGTGVNGSGPTTIVNGVLNPAGPNTGTITLPPGNYGVALRATNHSWRYQNFGTLQTFSNADLSATAGAASNAFLTLPTFSPRVFCGAINYTLGGTPMAFAQREPYGEGCYKYFRSFYEFMGSTATNQDLSNRSITFTFDSVNNRYSNVAFDAVPVAPVTPVSLPLAGAADDNNLVINLEPATGPQPILFPNIGGVGVAAATVEMCSNGYINLLGTNAPGTGNPTTAAFLTGTPRIGNWVDLNPTVAPGAMHYDYDAVNQQHLFTWNNCDLSGIATSPSTFQIAFFASGDVQIRYGTMSLLGGGGWPTLVGFSPGGVSADPGTIDLSVDLPISTSGIDQPPLALAANVNPVLGSTVNLTTSNETGISLGLCFVTLSDLPPFSPVGLDLGIIGAPGCVANVDINQGVGNLISNAGLPGVSMTVPFAIPSGPPSIIGNSFYCQSVWLDATQNAGGMLTSNALRLRVGIF